MLADDPWLDVRHVLVSRQPRAVVFDARLRTPPSAAVVRPGTIVVTSEALLAGPSVPDGPGGGAAERQRELAARGVEIVTVPAGSGGGVSLAGAMRRLADLDVVSVFAEPGLTLARALLDADLVDRLVLHVAAHLGDGPPRRALPVPSGSGWRTERTGGAGPDLVLHLVRDVVAPDDTGTHDATDTHDTDTRAAGTHDDTDTRVSVTHDTETAMTTDARDLEAS